jgi:hypothetical protein
VCGWSEEPPDDAAIEEHREEREGHVDLSYDMQFLPDAPAHHIGLRVVADNDAYVGGEIRYLPASDVVGEGRVGAGLDLFGGGGVDLTLGLWIGTAGKWVRSADAALLYAAPIAGTEIGVGFEGRHLFARYRWVAGLGPEPLDSLLTENELTFGYKLTRALHVYGQYLVLSPGDVDNESGVGLGARVAF